MAKDQMDLYIDCFSGISGDMMVGALVDLGVGTDFLREELKKLGLEGYNIDCFSVKANSLPANKFKVEITSPQPYRTYKEITQLVSRSELREKVKDISLRIFEEIAKAEAKVHRQSAYDVHFHEVGAVDTIVDVVSTAICVDNLNPDAIFCSAIPLGRGVAKTCHGTIPVPAPATLEILKDLPVYGGGFNFEVTTPTGAAIVKALVKDFGDLPLMEIKKVGLGAGDLEGKKIPNVLRVIQGKIVGKFLDKASDREFGCEEEHLILLSTNIDDSSSELIGYLLEILQTMALDAWVESIYMKKNRPAFKVCALCSPGKEYEVVKTIFKESTTFGVRREEIKRYTLKRQTKKINLPYGEVDIKVGIFQGKEITFSPEFESCKRLAEKLKKPLKEIYQDVIFLLSNK